MTRNELIARRLYREWMRDDYAESPWDDHNTPSNETEREARFFADIIIEELDKSGLTATSDAIQKGYKEGISRARQAVFSLPLNYVEKK